MDKPAHDEALRLCLAAGGNTGVDLKHNLTEQRYRAAEYLLQIARQIVQERQAEGPPPPAEQPKETPGPTEQPTEQWPDLPDAEPKTRARRRRRRK